MSNKLISYEEIQTVLQVYADHINKKYDEVTLLMTLTGGVYTGIDLSKFITIPCKLEFIKVSSYGNEEESDNVELQWTSLSKEKDLGNIILIDDICDTGKTLEYLIKYVKGYKHKSIETFTLLDKPSRRKVVIDPDRYGFVISNLFVYGYGLDNSGYDRNLKDIYYKE